MLPLRSITAYQIPEYKWRNFKQRNMCWGFIENFNYKTVSCCNLSILDRSSRSRHLLQDLRGECIHAHYSMRYLRYYIYNINNIQFLTPAILAAMGTNKCLYLNSITYLA